MPVARDLQLFGELSGQLSGELSGRDLGGGVKASGRVVMRLSG